jgi:hypothetical protein
MPCENNDDDSESESEPDPDTDPAADDDDCEEGELPENAGLMLSASPVTISELRTSPFSTDPNVKLDDDTDVIDDEGDPDGAMLAVISDISGFPIVALSKGNNEDSDKLEVGCIVAGTSFGRI